MKLSERGLALLAKRYGTAVSADAFEMLEDLVNSHVTVDLNQNQFDALACWAHDITIADFKASTLLRELNAGHATVASELARWNKKGGVKQDWLAERRRAEILLYLTPETVQPPLPPEQPGPVVGVPDDPETPSWLHRLWAWLWSWFS